MPGQFANAIYIGCHEGHDLSLAGEVFLVLLRGLTVAGVIPGAILGGVQRGCRRRNIFPN